ncbi:hypothetical protein PFNF135_06096 [Plasmodium falciparum NF135/5.C10]|uniref:Uncharacterized protein n=1 Tax=Plasmodium falciparum NF135/5.C10 TaxID=1036726 RepID=W4I8Q4_PLAFA|nr:hypothetical protein PFNF135_06096 [Plasmodium falciparum NF135/5.C10]
MNVKVEEGHPYNSYAEIKKRKIYMIYF